MTFSLLGIVVEAITVVMVAIGLPGLFGLMTVESFGIPPIPSEVILPFAGFLVAEGAFPLGWTIAVAIGGGLVGAFLGYAVGRWWRSRLIGFGVGQFRVRAEDLDRFERWFARRGEATVALGRTLPVVRGYISYPAGAARMSPGRFGVYTLVGSVPWTVGLVYLGMVLGANWTALWAYTVPIDIAFAVALVLAGVYAGLVALGYLRLGWPPRRGPRAPKGAVAGRT